MSTVDVKDLLAERGITVSREAIRLWINRFGSHFTNCIRRDRPSPNNKWHLDEVVITIRGRKHWLWRAIDAQGGRLDILVQAGPNAKAAKRFLTRLIRQFGTPRIVITDKLRSYIKPIRHLSSMTDHRAHKGLNNAIEVSHRPTRKREKSSGGLNPADKLRGFSLRMITLSLLQAATARQWIKLIFRPHRYQLTAPARNDAFSLWADYTAEMAAPCFSKCFTSDR